MRLIFNLFKRRFLKYAFDEQSKPRDFEKLTQTFIDSNGLKYYMYKDDLDIPIARRGEGVKYIQELQAGLDRDELGLFVDAMQKCLERKVKGKLDPDYTTIGFLITEIKMRKEVLFHPGILFNLAATLYVREDENPAVIDSQIHAQKVEQFKADSVGGLYDFFYNGGLREYLTFTDISEIEFNKYLEKSRVMIAAMQTTLSQISKSE